MTAATHGELLEAIPPRIGLITPDPRGLVRTSIGLSVGARLEGRRVTVLVPPDAGPARIEFDGRSVVEGLRADLGQVANSATSPGLQRRERVGPGGVVTETILAAPSLPLVWIQWHSAGSTLPISVDVELDPAELKQGNPLAERVEYGVVLRGARKDRSIVAFATGGGRVAFDGGPRPLLRVAADSLSAGPVTLVLAVGSDAELRGALTASGHAQAHAVRATGGAEGDGLATSTGVEEVDDGVQWARARLHGMAARLESGASDDPETALLIGLAALAVGDGVGAREALNALADRSMERAILAGRLAGVLGDPGPAAAIRETVLTEGTEAPTALGGLAARVLADGLRYAAPEARIAELRAYSIAATRETRAPTADPRALPMVGRPSASRDARSARWLEALIGGNPLSRSSDPGPAHDLHHATALFPDDPDGGWALWRRIVSEGLSGGPDGVATWGSSDTAMVLLALTQGLLGVSPDAPVGRIRIAPRVPAHLRRFTACGIPIGEGRLRFDFERTGSVLRYTVTPEIAPVPPLLVLEPSVAGRVTGTRVDGAAADLRPRPEGPRTVVPVQLPVDGPRTLEVTLSD